MPELPEVESVRRSLLDPLLGATIHCVKLNDFTGCIASPDPATFAARVAGRTIADIKRRAKYLLIELDSDETIAIHLRMTGELSLTAPTAPSSRHHHLSFVLGDQRELRFSDVRKFGRLRLLTPEEMDALDRSLGPEPMSDDLTQERFARMLAARTRAVKPLLLEQTFLAGIGNIYADEALFMAGIHPLRPADSLGADEASRLLSAIRETLSGSITRGGTTLRDYRDGLGRNGTNQYHLRIYPLPDGAACPNCGGPITRIVVAQRGTKLCPRCQPLPPSARPGRLGRSR